MSNITPSGIVRPRSGNFSSFDAARATAKALNLSRGRGHRALRAQDGTAVVIFRPAVAANRQARVRVPQGL